MVTQEEIRRVHAIISDVQAKLHVHERTQGQQKERHEDITTQITVKTREQDEAIGKLQAEVQTMASAVAAVQNDFQSMATTLAKHDSSIASLTGGWSLLGALQTGQQ